MSSLTINCPACNATNLQGASTCIGCQRSLLAGSGAPAAPSYMAATAATGTAPAFGSSSGQPYTAGAFAGFSAAHGGGALEPFSMGRALRLTVSAWVKNAPFVLLMAALLYLPLFLFFRVGSMEDLVAMQEGALTLESRWVQIYSILAQSLLAAVLAFAIFQALSGKRVTFGEALSTGLKRMFPVLGVSIAYGLIVGVGTLFLVIPGLIFMCMLYVAVPAAVIEAPGIGGALGRSRDLTDGHRLAIFGLALALGLANMGMAYLIEQSLFGDLTESKLEAMSPEKLVSTVNYAIVVNVGWMAITASFFAVSTVVVYFLLRKSKEGTNADELAAVFQ